MKQCNAGVLTGRQPPGEGDDGRNLDSARVGAPYLVDRDGSVYQTFDDAEWIYHLGLKGTNGYYDRASVAIEFANELRLQLDSDQLYAFGMNTPNTVYTGPYLTYQWPRPSPLRPDGRGPGGRGDRADPRASWARKRACLPTAMLPSISSDSPRASTFARPSKNTPDIASAHHNPSSKATRNLSWPR